MEQQLIEMLDILKQGLAELPSIGADVWNVMVIGTRIGGALSLVITIALIVIYVKIMLKLVAEYKRAEVASNTFGRGEVRDLLLILIGGGVAGFTLTLISIITLYFGAMDLLVPEYTIIKDVINSLGM